MKRLGLACGAPLLVLLAAEAILRLAGFGHPTSYFVPAPGNPGRLLENPDFGRLYFPPGLLRVPPPTSISRIKSAGTVRILVFGESAAMGDPKPAFGVARYLEVLLEERYPGTVFEVIPVAMTAINSHALLPMARESAALGADYWIVYAGNNEMLGPFGAGAALGGNAGSAALVRLVLAAKGTRLGQAVAALGNSLHGRPEGSSRWSGLRVLAGESVTSTSSQRTRVYAAFERNLRDLVRAGQAGGAQVLISTVAVNLRDCGPFGSAHEPLLEASRLAEWNRHFQAGVSAVTNAHFAEALEEFRAASALGERHAALQFLSAEAALGISNRTAAVSAFALARDLDTIPLRTDSRLNEIARRVAAERSAPLIDAAAELAATARDVVPGSEYFYEHVHLMPEGNYALARVFADALAPRLPEPVRSRSQPEWPTAESCATRLALTPWSRAAAFETMLRRCLDAPFTNRPGHDRQILALAGEVSRLRRTMTPESAGFVRGVYTNAITRAPDDHLMRRNFAEFLEATGDLREAAAQWKRVVELIPHHPFAHLQAGSLLRRLGNLDEARPLIERAVAMQSDWVEARLELADLFLARGRPHEAILACRDALKIQPDHARAHLHLADALAADKQRDAAVHSLEDAVRLDSNLWEARYLLGVEYALQERIPEARAQFEEVIRLKPDHGRARFNLGIALARQQQWEPAAAHLAEAIRLDPKNEEARRALAQIAAIRRQQTPLENSPPSVPAPVP